MPQAHRVAVWFGKGLENALAARAWLGQLQAENPGAEWVLLGPQGSLYLFEMDSRVSAFIPLLQLEPPRPTQPRLLRYFAERRQFRQIRELRFSQCFGVAVSGSGNESAQPEFAKFISGIGLPGQLLEKALPDFLLANQPLLQAGPQALAFATRLHRASPPHLPKLLVLLACPAIGNDKTGLELEQQWNAAQANMRNCEPAHITVAVVNAAGNRLLVRWLNQHYPDWLPIDLSQAMGLISDWFLTRNHPDLH
jgi:hypothetical protein